jgi:hypothetical protein
MSRAPSAAGSEQGQSSLFGEGELPAGRSLVAQPNAGTGEPRLLRAQRDQVELLPYDPDALLPADLPVRSVWAFVQALDLAPLYAAIKSVRGGPALLVALWLWAGLAHTFGEIGFVLNIWDLHKRLRKLVLILF